MLNRIPLLKHPPAQSLPFGKVAPITGRRGVALKFVNCQDAVESQKQQASETMLEQSRRINPSLP